MGCVELSLLCVGGLASIKELATELIGVIGRVVKSK